MRNATHSFQGTPTGAGGLLRRALAAFLAASLMAPPALAQDEEVPVAAEPRPAQPAPARAAQPAPARTGTPGSGVPVAPIPDTEDSAPSPGGSTTPPGVVQDPSATDPLPAVPAKPSGPAASPLPGGRPAGGTRVPGKLSGNRGGSRSPAAQPIEPGNAAGPLKADTNCIPLKGKMLLTFDKADLVDVLKQASRWTCRNFIYTDDIARGKITLLSQVPVTSEEAYAAFVSALSANNIVIYPAGGRYLRLARIADAKKSPIPLVDDKGRAPASEQPVTKIFRLGFTEPEQLKGILGNFTSPQGADIQSIPPDMLIVTDTGLNIRRLERILDQVDQPGGGDTLRIIQVKHASAKDIAEKLNQIFSGAQGQGGKPATRRVISGTSSTSRPGAATSRTTDAVDVSISKVMPDERTNKLIVLANEKSFQRILDIVRQLDVPTSGEGQIQVVPLKNASAEDLAQTLQALSQGSSGTATRRAPSPSQPRPAATGGPPAAAELFGGEVKITADKATNSLVIQASASDFFTLSRLIEKLDQPRRQVFIEAVVMEVNVSHNSLLGVSMHTAVPTNVTAPFGRTPASGTGLVPLSSQPTPKGMNSLNPASLVGLGGFLTGLMGPPIDLTALGLPGGVPSFGLLFQALQQNTDANILSTPHILTSDNEEAEIVVGSKVPFVTGGIPPGIIPQTGTTPGVPQIPGLPGGLFPTFNVQREPVELKLKLKPQISEGENIRLEVDESIEEIAGEEPNTKTPITSKRTAKTKIVVRDQHTVVIGGIIQDKVTKTVTKTPLLGDIPILGYLFRSTDTKKTKTNLLLFLTPYIIRDHSDFRKIFERKMKERQEIVEQFYGRQKGYEVPIDWTRKSGPFTKMRREVSAEMARVENGGAGAAGERIIRPVEPGAEGDGVSPAVPLPPEGRPENGAPPPASGEIQPLGAEPQGGEPDGHSPSPADAPPPDGAPDPMERLSPPPPPPPPPGNQ
jgi:general secretion pathway protein D